MSLFSNDGYEKFKEEFKKIYLKKHREYGKELFNFKEVNPLSTFIQKKIEYYTNYTEMKFDDSLEQIKYGLPDDAIEFIDKLKVKNVESLKKAADIYHKFSRISARKKDLNDQIRNGSQPKVVNTVLVNSESVITNSIGHSIITYSKTNKIVNVQRR